VASTGHRESEDLAGSEENRSRPAYKKRSLTRASRIASMANPSPGGDTAAPTEEMPSTQ
jgi:hypothetical protein